MKLIKWLFGSRGKSKSKYDGFDIEYLPHANRYFPRYKGKYIFWRETMQNYSLSNNISGCLYGIDKDDAKEIIDRYLELRGVGSNVISVD